MDSHANGGMVLVTEDAVLLTEKQVSILTGIKIKTLQAHRHDGLDNGLPYVRVGRLVRYPLPEVLKHIQENRLEPVRVPKKRRHS